MRARKNYFSVGVFPSSFSFVLAVTLSAVAANAVELEDLVVSGAKAEKVVGDCVFTEGPAWSPDGYLLFSDIPNSRIVRYDPKSGSTDFLKPSGKANGLAFALDGKLYACQGEARQVVRIDPATKDSTTLADRHGGKKLNSPNDLALDAHGGVYFTDPRYGAGSGPEEQPVRGVYYIARDGKLSRIIEDLDQPNGILVSPNGKFLYVAVPNRRELYRYRIDSPGKIRDKQLIFTGDAERDGGGPDGMAHDAHGNIYATYKDVVVLTGEGELIGRIEVPENTANCTFGGADGKTLYVTARTSLYKISMKVPGMGYKKLAGSLSLQIPANWKESKPSSRMRVAQFALPRVGSDQESPEFVIYYFGPGGAGGVRANIARWINQFEERGRKSKIFRATCATGGVTLLQQTGTYKKSVGPPIVGKSEPVPGSAMIAAIVETKRGFHFIKLTGPKKSVLAARRAVVLAIGTRGEEREIQVSDL